MNRQNTSITGTQTTKLFTPVKAYLHLQNFAVKNALNINSSYADLNFLE